MTEHVPEPDTEPEPPEQPPSREFNRDPDDDELEPDDEPDPSSTRAPNADLEPPWRLASPGLVSPRTRRYQPEEPSWRPPHTVRSNPG
jgi:hypothetical protein